MRRTLNQIRAILVEGGPAAAHAVSARVRAGVYLGRLGLRILKQWARDRCPQQAAALAFQSTLSLVPVLAIGIVVLRGTGLMDAESRLADFLAQQIFPELPDLGRHLRDFSEKISTGAAGVGGLAFTFVACYALYSNVGRIFNDIWRVHVRRPRLYRMLTFYALVTLLPGLAGAYIYWSGRLAHADWMVRLGGPLGIQFAALLATNKLLPNTVVRWRPALMGTVVSGVLLEALKWGFIAFARRMMLASYSGIYGSVALVPMVLGWIYVSWLIILLGAETANAIQNLRRLEAEDRRHRGEEPLNGVVAAQFLCAIARDFDNGGKGVTRESLSQDFALSPWIVESVCDRLKARRFIAEVQGDKQGFVLAMPASAIAVEDILGAFRATELERAEGEMPEPLVALTEDLEDARRTRLRGLTLADLVRRDEGLIPLPSAQRDETA